MSTSRNRLGAEKSPYLLQHKDNPVHWYAWGDDTFAAARAENKPNQNVGLSHAGLAALETWLHKSELMVCKGDVCRPLAPTI